MVEPVLPAGATIAVFIMTVIGWYGMLRNGVQTVHDDIEGHKSAEDDVLDMLVDLKHQETSLQDWRRYWRISEQTPDAVLLQFWGETRFNLIKEKINRMVSDLVKAREKLGRLAEMTRDEWAHLSKAKKIYYKQRLIWSKKNWVLHLIDRLPKNMTVIKEESDAGWKEQREIRAREIAHTTPYHDQVAYLLVQIAMQNLKGAEALRNCCRVAGDDVAVFLDLDLFDAFATVTEDQHVDRIARAHHVGHLKLELLLRESDRQRAELTRVVVERVSNETQPESRVVDAFKAILDPLHRKLYFRDASTFFCLSRFRREREHCSRLQQSLREVLADQDLPRYNSETELLDNHASHVTMLTELSTARAAFELAQACLLFLRTNWICELCRCTVRCGVLSNTSTARWHQFGLDLVKITHQAPRWRNPGHQVDYVDGSLEESWCMARNPWCALIKPIRHLGLLLVEISLGTTVFPEIDDDRDGSAAICRVRIVVRAEPVQPVWPVWPVWPVRPVQPGAWKWETVSLGVILKLVRQSYNDSEHIARAIEYCLTGSFPSGPSDDEMETQLRHFYFRVVKPYVFTL